MAILREVLPERMVPALATLLAQCRAGTGPPAILVTEGVPGPGRVRFDADAVRVWALAQYPERVRTAVRLLVIAEMADALGLETTPHPDGGVTMYDADAVLYSGDLDGAERWLAEEAAAEKVVAP